MGWVFVWAALGAVGVVLGWASGFTEHPGELVAFWAVAAFFFALAWVAKRDLHR